MTIHTEHPFADPSPDPVRRLRGRLGGAVSLWISGTGPDRAGLTVSSVMAANGEPARLLALVDPDSALADALDVDGTAVMSLLGWEDRGLAEMFAGTAPAPGGVFAQAEFVDVAGYGARPAGADTWVSLTVEDRRTVGWSDLVTARIDAVTLEERVRPALGHHRGRFYRLPD